MARKTTKARGTKTRTGSASAVSRAMGIAVAVATLAAPAVIVAMVSTAVGSTPRDALSAFAAHHRGLEGGTFALPLAFGVAWPTAVLCAAVTLSAHLSSSSPCGRKSGSTRAEESKKER